MTEEQSEILGHYLRWVADEVGLRDWTIIVSDENPGDEDAVACCEPIHGQKCAILRFSNTFLVDPPDDQVNTCVHELMHCHTAAVEHQIEFDLEEHLGKVAHDIFYAAFRNNIEYAVDGIASSWARDFPPIDWSGEKMRESSEPKEQDD